MRWFCLVVGLSLGNMTFADTLVMLNGDRLSGRLDSITGGKAIFETSYAGRILVNTDEIRTLETDESYSIRLTDRTIEGYFASQENIQQLRISKGNQRLLLTEVRVADQSRDPFSSFTAEWSTRLDLALSLAEGNTTTEASNLLLETDYKDDANAHLVTVLLAREEGEGLLTKDQLDVDYGYRRFLSERWYGAANAEYFQDTLKDIDARITVGAGLGVQFIDNTLENLASDISLSAVQENTDGDSDVEPALRWGLDYQRFLFAKTVELFHRQTILQLLGEEKGQVFSSSSGLRYAYNERIDTTFRVDLAYESDPTLGNESTDTTYSLGVGVKF